MIIHGWPLATAEWPLVTASVAAGRRQLHQAKLRDFYCPLRVYILIIINRPQERLLLILQMSLNVSNVFFLLSSFFV